MSTISSTLSTNPHIESLERLFEDTKTSIKWLVIAHNDGRMVGKLSSALSGESAAVLEASQDTWDFEGQDLPEVIEWALQQGEIENLVLVGHSQSGGAASRALRIGPSRNGNAQGKQPAGNSDRLIAGVQQANAGVRDAQARFAAHVQQMSQIPVVHGRWANGELAIYGLFYRAEAGLFMSYDPANDRFRPLMS